MPYRRTPQIQARIDAQRAAILEAGAELLSEYGYAGCSVSAVAARAGIATGGVYRHFSDKAELVAELFRVVVGREVAAVERAGAGHGDLPDRIIAVVETFAGRAFKAPRLAYAMLAEPVDAAVERERLVFRQRFADVFTRWVEDGMRAGTLPRQNARLTAAAMVGAIAEVLVGPLAAGSAEPDTIPSLVTLMVRALGANDARHA